MKTIEEIENELLLKEQRVSYWEKHHSLPKNLDMVDVEVIL